MAMLNGANVTIRDYIARSMIPSFIGNSESNSHHVLYYS